MKVMVLTDNKYILEKFNDIITNIEFSDTSFDFYFSYTNKEFLTNYNQTEIKSINLKEEVNFVIANYDLVLSLHCKQLFPNKLVQQKRCINIHPGLNPYNRGWYPQVFSIINKLPIGVTIHEMDEKLDHGPIIVQKEIKIESFETSFDVYSKIQLLEIRLLKAHLRDILDNNYKVVIPSKEGNINLKKDFVDLCEIDLNKKVTYKEAIDYLRAMSFEGYKNAYFKDEQGNKIYLNINLYKDE